MTTERLTDVVIIGGGVAGASLGAALAQAGLGVTVVEREARFRDRVRGEGIHAWGVAEASKLGLLDVLRDAGATELPQWRTFANRELISEPMNIPAVSKHGYGEWSIYHPAMQDALIAHAEACGATILRPAKVANVRTGRKPEVIVSMVEGALQIRSRLVVGADGRLSGVRRLIGASSLSDSPDTHHVGGCLIRGHSIHKESVHIGTSDRAFTFTIPRADGTVRTYLIASPDELARYRVRGSVTEFIRACEALLPERSFAESKPAGPLAIFPGTNIWSDRVTAEGVVLIGDAAMATDPSFGCGLSLVFRDVRELRDLLLTGDDWQIAIEEFSRRHTAYAQSVRCLTLWNSSLTFSSEPDIEARRERFRLARERDPEGGGYGSLIQSGPGDGFPIDDAMRRRWLGEDLEV